jgi:hypothetical protein
MAAVFTAISLTTLGALIFKENIERSAKIDVVSAVNNKKYAVMQTGDYVAAADMLASLEDKARAFIAAASEKYPNDNTIKRIQKYWTGTISEIPQSDTIAYALEKRDLFMCVRDNAGNVQQLDDLLFVLLHELSHIMNTSYGHDAPFWRQFKRTLEMANKLGYLPYTNYDQYSVTVCGKVINANPATCVFNGQCESELSDLTPIRPSR